MFNMLTKACRVWDVALGFNAVFLTGTPCPWMFVLHMIGGSQSESPSKQSFYCHHELESLLKSTDVSVCDFSKYKGRWGESQEGLRRRLKSQRLVCLFYSPRAIYTSEGRGVRGHQGSWRDQENTGRLLHIVSFLLSGNPLHVYAALTHHTHKRVMATDPQVGHAESSIRTGESMSGKNSKGTQKRL